MKPRDLNSLTQQLRRRREALFREVADTEADLQFIAEDRESEFEERAQEERAARLFARLDLRGKHAIEEIDAALRRIADGSYGVCATCGRAIPVARLRAVPATRFCVNCARAQETPAAAEVEIPTVGPLPADMSLLTDRELEDALRELVREDGRIDMEELRLVCRHGVVVLDGALPSETEHQILRKLMTDVAGLLELVDRLQVKEILWDRLDRSKRVPGAVEPLRAEPSGTEDVVKSLEEGLDFVPPAGPAAEEE